MGGLITSKRSVTVNTLEYFKNSIKNNRETEKLQSILLECSDYKQVDIKQHSLVYLDPPYASTVGYIESFDHKAFYIWVKQVAKHSLVFISEYMMPANDFELHSEYALNGGLTNVNCNTNGCEKRVSVERLYTVKNGWLTSEIYDNDFTY